MYRWIATLTLSVACLSSAHGQQQEPKSEAAEPERQVRIPTEKSIAMFQQRVAKNPKDYRSLTVLGQLYMRHAKESDDHSAMGKAEQAFRKALEIKPDHFPAKTYLATALQAEHRFADALALAEEVFQAKPNDTLALATIGDSQIELGLYDDAEKSYLKLASRTKSAPVLARLAHMAELKGEPAQAIELIQKALTEVTESGLSGSSMAWYELRLADLHEGQGQLDMAAKHFRSALSHQADYAPAMSGLANVLALQGKHDEALALYNEAVERHGEPPMMAALGDLLAHLGQHDRAKQLYDKADEAMAEEAETAAEAHYREVSLFYSNHDRKTDQAVKLAKADMTLRQDIYAHDTLAWALHKNGQHQQALDSIEQALRLKTRDATLHFHAGMIHFALGDSANAKAALEMAIEINPHFSLLGAPVAQRTLKQLASAK